MPRKKPNPRKIQQNFRLDRVTVRELTIMAKKNGLSKTVFLTYLIATEASRKDYEIPL